jgi:hypothetical protein
MADRRGGKGTPRIKGGTNHGQNRARRSSAPAPGGSARWRAKRSDAGKPRRK